MTAPLPPIAYTKTDWQAKTLPDGSANPAATQITAARLNNVEGGMVTLRDRVNDHTPRLEALEARPIPSPTNGGAIRPSEIWVSDMTSTTDDGKLGQAMTLARSKPNGLTPAIVIDGKRTFSGTYDWFPGLTLTAPHIYGGRCPERSAGSTVATNVTLNCGSGDASFLRAPLTQTVSMYGGYVGGLNFFSGNASAQFFHWPLNRGSLFQSEFESLGFVGFYGVIGNATTKAAFTLGRFSGDWNVTGARDTQFHFGGSDIQGLWTGSKLNLGPNGNLNNGAGRYLMIIDSMGKTPVGSIFFTCDDGWRGCLVKGSSKYNGGLSASGWAIEGRNANDPSFGALLRVEGNFSLRDSWIAYGMSNPTAHPGTTKDAGVIEVAGANAHFSIENCHFGLATGTTAATAPLIAARSGATVWSRWIKRSDGVNADGVPAPVEGVDWGTSLPVIKQFAGSTVVSDFTTTTVAA